MMRAFASLVVFAAATAAPLSAQQRVMLEARPKPGDTLRVTLDHVFTITGGPKNAPDSATTVSTSYHIATRDVAEREDRGGTIIRARIDTVRMKTSGSMGASPFPGVDRGMEGMTVKLRVMPDGSSELVEGQKQLDKELVAMLGAMPAVLPTAPVAVGESWVRDLPLPADGGDAGNASGTLKATFKFDSLTSGGDVAWVSIQGRVVSDGKAAKDGPGIGQPSGTLAGLLRLDRKRGWLAESRATVTLESVVTLAGGGPPLVVKVHVNQVMHTAPARR
ncbi:MAG TPA: hypothetical protein VE967_02010 [Gemmatimonadaceae bacterium]|nr:hypothetical protein [Gemmatimonadaceae bacterium]